MPGQLYYYVQNGEHYGPVEPYQLQQLIQQGTVRRDDLVWTEGMAEWLPASTVPGLRPRVPQPRMPQHAYSQGAQASGAYANPQPAADQGFATYAATEAAPLGYQTRAHRPAQAPPTGLAIASMVLGIVAVFFSILAWCAWIITLPTTILAIVFGWIALNRSRPGDGARGMAIAGLTLGLVSAAIFVIVLLTVGAIVSNSRRW